MNNQYKRYQVTFTSKFQTAGIRDNEVKEYEALNAADAIKQARRELYYAGHDGKRDGAIYLRATLIK